MPISSSLSTNSAIIKKRKFETTSSGTKSDKGYLEDKLTPTLKFHSNNSNMTSGPKILHVAGHSSCKSVFCRILPFCMTSIDRSIAFMPTIPCSDNFPFISIPSFGSSTTLFFSQVAFTTKLRDACPEYPSSFRID